MMYNRNKRFIKYLLVLLALFIGFGSIVYTRSLVKVLKDEEKKKVELWAQATAELSSSETSSLNLMFNVIKNNTTVPVILTDSAFQIISYRNIQISTNDSLNFLRSELAEMRDHHDSIIIDLGDKNYQILFYKESNVITKLTSFTLLQLIVVVVFVFIAYLAFSNNRKIEQNRVWVGMSKETAHQLGTPTSSLLGWVGLLKLKEVEPDLVQEIEKDIIHLQRVVDRFSKIGSEPELVPCRLLDIITNTVGYLKIRTSSLVDFSVESKIIPTPVVNLNQTLFEWVLENICKNGVDAIEGKGLIKITISEGEKYVYVDISDTGKGILKKHFKSIFLPGYTTKKRGWGLGLSLSQRIIESYHKGKLFVKESEAGKGTTIRISLIKSK